MSKITDAIDLLEQAKVKILEARAEEPEDANTEESALWFIEDAADACSEIVAILEMALEAKLEETT